MLRFSRGCDLAGCGGGHYRRDCSAAGHGLPTGDSQEGFGAGEDMTINSAGKLGIRDFLIRAWRGTQLRKVLRVFR